MLTKLNKVERMITVNTLLTSIYEELLKDEVDDIDGLLQIAVYAQVEMNRIVFDLNQRNGCEPTADTPQTDCDKCIWNVCNYNKVDWDADTPQTDCGWGEPRNE